MEVFLIYHLEVFEESITTFSTTLFSSSLSHILFFSQCACSLKLSFLRWVLYSVLIGLTYWPVFIIYLRSRMLQSDGLRINTSHGTVQNEIEAWLSVSSGPTRGRQILI